MGRPAAENGAAALDRATEGGNGKQNHAGSGGRFECRLPVRIAPDVPAVPPRDISHLRALGVQLCVSFANYVSDVDREFDSI